MSTLTNVRLKLARAEEHLHELDDEIASYLDSEPYKIVKNVQPQDRELVFIEFHVTAEPDARLGVIIGDCLHNLRSALDYLACGLVERNGGTVTRRTQFPILIRQPTDEAGTPKLPSIAGGVAPKVLEIIDESQPYKNREDAPTHPLLILRHLSNADKHRLLHPVAAYLKDGESALHFAGTVLRSLPSAAVLHHEGALGAFKLPKPFDVLSSANVQVEAKGQAFVAIQEAEPLTAEPVTHVLEAILRFVRADLVGRLHSFLD